MIIDELVVSSSYRLAKVLKILESMYSVTIDFGAAENLSELVSIYEECGATRHGIINESAHNSHNRDSEYAKACLIQEAIRLFLSEIAPKRRSRHKQDHA